MLLTDTNHPRFLFLLLLPKVPSVQDDVLEKIEVRNIVDQDSFCRFQ